MTLNTKYPISYISSESYLEAKGWEKREPIHINLIAWIVFLGIVSAIITVIRSHKFSK